MGPNEPVTARLGYKLHLTETCDDPPACTCPPAADPPDRRHDKGCEHLVFPNVITNVATTDATVNQMTEPIHDALAARNLKPGRH